MLIAEGHGNCRCIRPQELNQSSHLRRSMHIAHNARDGGRAVRVRSGTVHGGRCKAAGPVSEHHCHRQHTRCKSFHRAQNLMCAPTALQKVRWHLQPIGSSCSEASSQFPSAPALLHSMTGVTALPPVLPVPYCSTINGALCAIACFVTPSFTLIVTW